MVCPRSKLSGKTLKRRRGGMSTISFRHVTSSDLKKKRPVFRRECNNIFSTGCGIRNVHFRHYEKTVGHFSTYHGRQSQRRHFLKSCFVLRILPYRCWRSGFGQVFIRPGLFSDPRAASQLVASVFAGRDVTAYARPRSISPHSQLE